MPACFKSAHAEVTLKRGPCCLVRPHPGNSNREELEGRKIEGLTFRLMPQTVLGHTLSFGSKEDLWWQVCKDWLEVMSPAPRGEENGAQD